LKVRKLCGQNAKFLTAKLEVHAVTAGFQDTSYSHWFLVGNEINNERFTDHESTAWPSEYMQGRYASNSKRNVAV